MDTPNAPSDDGPLTGTIVVEPRTVRRPLTRAYWIVAVAVPVLLTIGIGVSRGPGIEDALKKDVQQALANADLENVAVSTNGRMVTAEVPTGVDAEAVKNLVSEVDGVSAVSAKLVYASYAEARDCANLQDKLDKATNKQRIPFQGQTAQLTSEGAAMLRAAGKLLDACGTAVVYVGGHTDPSTRYGSTISLDRAKLMAKLLKSYGVKADRLEPRGYGDQFPIDKSDSAAGRARNERGSIIVRSQ
jgi:outer membrane protein OmpA-like peptidoglycan-associated protein